MGLIKRVFGTNGAVSLADEEFIDLRNHEMPGSGAHSWVRVGEVRRVEDVKHLASHVYDGNTLILDFSRIADDEIALKRITTELKRVAKDVDGDLAGLGSNTLVVTPGGVKVDRSKLRVER